MAFRKKKLRILTVGVVVGGLFGVLNVTPIMASENTIPVTLDAEPLILDVTVPTVFSFVVDNNEEVIKSTNNKITNNSVGAVVVDNITIEGKDGWKIVDFGKDFGSTPVGTKELGFSLNTYKTKGSQLEFKDQLKIDGVGGNSQLPLAYDGRFPKQTEEATDHNIAGVTFYVDWYK